MTDTRFNVAFSRQFMMMELMMVKRGEEIGERKGKQGKNRREHFTPVSKMIRQQERKEEVWKKGEKERREDGKREEKMKEREDGEGEKEMRTGKTTTRHSANT